MMMRRTADRLLGRENYRWSVLGAGRSQMGIAAMAASMGGNVRVGLEDSLWIGPGKLAETNAQQVTNVRKIIEGLGLEIATADEAREEIRNMMLRRVREKTADEWMAIFRQHEDVALVEGVNQPVREPAETAAANTIADGMPSPGKARDAVCSG